VPPSRAGVEKQQGLGSTPSPLVLVDQLRGSHYRFEAVNRSRRLAVAQVPGFVPLELEQCHNERGVPRDSTCLPSRLDMSQVAHLL
jgi:hypothetical protein